MAKKEKSLFWASYADLMTSLFFVMLVLFIGVVVELVEERNKIHEVIDKMEDTIDGGKRENDLLTKKLNDMANQLLASKAEKKVLDEINNATRNIDSTYFAYEEKYKKHKLKIDVNYKKERAEINDLPIGIQNKLLAAGRKLRDFVQETINKNSDIQYLLIIEGQASKIGPESINYPLSYQRAYGLKQFWEDNGINFTAKNCEVLICGSGDGRQSGTGLMREQIETLNQRFLIHILPKPGQTNENNTYNSYTIVK